MNGIVVLVIMSSRAWDHSTVRRIVSVHRVGLVFLELAYTWSEGGLRGGHTLHSPRLIHIKMKTLRRI